MKRIVSLAVLAFFLRGTLGITAATLFGFTVAQAHETLDPPSAKKRPAIMKIVPAGVLEANSVFFGTGDCANGSWAR